MSAPVTPEPRPGRRLPGLDGLRGLAALYVVVYHVTLRAFPGYPGRGGPFWVAPLSFGRFAVLVFIVLSGFSLGLAPARHGWRLDGIRDYAARRARRILPAYWAALAFSLAVAWLIVPQPRSGVPDATSVLVNGAFLQNVVGAPSPNTAFWSIAVEVQLYLLLPALLLIARRRGAAAMVGAVTLVVVALGIVGPHVARLDTFVSVSAPDLAALFALGVAAAGIVGAGATRRAWPWHWLTLGLAAPVLATIFWRGTAWTLGHLYWVDLALAPGIACLLAGLATGRPAALARTLDARLLRGLGDCSYSLYLTHAPIVAIVTELIVAHWFHPGPAAFLVSLAIVVPLTIAFARGFAAVFEHGVFQRRREAGAVGGAVARANGAVAHRRVVAG
jgi:peptidoglycan/LPS O-acetylase OafA/YrhL